MLMPAPVLTVDAVLVLAVAEAGFLTWRYGMRLLPVLLAGLLLMLALRLSLTGGFWPAGAACLAAAGAAHIADLRLRLRARR